MAGALSKAGLLSTKAMIDRSHDLPLARQAELLRLGRSRLYYEPRPVSSAELAIMRQINECTSTIRSDVTRTATRRGHRGRPEVGGDDDAAQAY